MIMNGENQEKEAYPTLPDVSTKGRDQMVDKFPIIPFPRVDRQNLSEICCGDMLVVSRAGEAYDTRASGLN